MSFSPEEYTANLNAFLKTTNTLLVGPAVWKLLLHGTIPERLHVWPKGGRQYFNHGIHLFWDAIRALGPSWKWQHTNGIYVGTLRHNDQVMFTNLEFLAEKATPNYYGRRHMFNHLMWDGETFSSAAMEGYVDSEWKVTPTDAADILRQFETKVLKIHACYLLPPTNPNWNDLSIHPDTIRELGEMRALGYSFEAYGNH